MARLSTRDLRGENKATSSLHGVHLPEPFNGCSVIKEYRVDELPTIEVLTDVLEAHGANTATWGSGNTKAVSKYFYEIQGNEAGLELWKTREGKTMPVRVTHVLRAKVTSEDGYARNLFLFNTWQQYGDGRKRVRNGLLSEKLTFEEMPLVDHLHDVCQRAVTEEEMQRLCDCETRIGPGAPAPEYDANYKCPLNVTREVFVDHMVEIEPSKSYPGLVTAYHLYTVDIVCEGLPSVDFNTLEFEHPDKDGNRKLKYIHAWVWHEWNTIQRYLFDGSEMKERKSKGSFKDANELHAWLSQFDVGLEQWGKGQFKDVPTLFREIERSESQLERWGRDDGVPLLMRVVHVLQIKVVASEGSQWFLFQIWDQNKDGKMRDINRSLAKKLSAANLPFDAAHFEDVAKKEIQKNLTYLADVHMRLDTKKLPTPDSCDPSGIQVDNVKFLGHRFDLEDSKSFFEMTTMYHLYTVEVVCEGLPKADFASISFEDRNGICAMGWKWMTWQGTLDIMHQRTQMLEHREVALAEKIAAATAACEACLSKIGTTTGSKGFTSSSKGKDAEKIKDELKQVMDVLAAPITVEAPMYQRIPPSLVSNLADQKGVSDDFLDQALIAGRRRSSTDATSIPVADTVFEEKSEPLMAQEINGQHKEINDHHKEQPQAKSNSFFSLLCGASISPETGEITRG